MPFTDEKISSEFGVPNQEIGQTLSQSFDPFSGLDIDTGSFQNTKNGFLISNQDGRIPLGMFYFEDDNILKDNFPPKISNTSFRQIPKPNLVKNGSCQFIESITTDTKYLDANTPKIVFPGQNPRLDGWGYCSMDGVGVRDRVVTDTGATNYDDRGSFPEDTEGGINLQNSFEQSDNFDPTLDNQGVTGFAGWYPYLFHLQKILCWTTYQRYEPNPNRANDFLMLLSLCLAQHSGWNQTTGTWDFTSTNTNTSNQNDGRSYNLAGRYPLVPKLTAAFCNDAVTGNKVTFPNIAKWIQTDEAYSYGRCLDFTAIDIDNGFCPDLDGNQTQLTSTQNWSVTGDQDYNWSWSEGILIDDNFDEGSSQGSTTYRAGNQYRTLNQVTTIYIGADVVDEEERINPYTTMEIKFKMKTMEEGYDGSNPPQIELAVIDGDYYTGDPRRWEAKDPDIYDGNKFDKNHHYWPHGDFNTLKYDANDNPPGNLNNRYSNFGSMGRFQNTQLNTWETFTYKFVLSDVFRYSTPPSLLRRLSMIVQAAGNFKGRVLLDNFECYESGDFTPDVDVRKKISVGNYGKADLTKYYDKDLQPEEYADTTGPLEAQFYFYPQYPTTNVFGQKRTPIYQDFKVGKFYIYDIDWGDGSSKEHSSKPKQIDEETALYHTYQTNGIFEVTGTMIRMKTNVDGDLLGIIHNKKFTLRININEGFGEDFQYFGSNGFSFIPYKNTTPIIGGISNQSLYYKSLKRQLGFVSDNIKTNVNFKYDGDKLKTELALLKIENQNDEDLDILPNYMIPRYDNGLGLGNYMLQPSIEGQSGYPEENQIIWNYGDLLINTDNIPAGLIQIFRFSDATFVEFNEDAGVWDTINSQWDTLQNGILYSFIIKVGDSPVGWSLLNNLLPEVSNVLIYNGISPIKEELGTSIGDCDVACIKYYNEPKNLSDLFGFNNRESTVNLVARENEFMNRRTRQIVSAGTLYHIHPNQGPMEGATHNPNIQGGTSGHDFFDNTIGIPNNDRYWKRIIPKNYSVFNRDGLVRIGDNELDYVIPNSEQDWLNDYYYPVLPKYNNGGKFEELKLDEDGNVPLGFYPNNKIPFPINSAITDESELNKNLTFSITTDNIENNVFIDKAGNGNLGLAIGDYRTKFDNKTLKPKKTTTYDKIKKSISNGAF